MKEDSTPNFEKNQRGSNKKFYVSEFHQKDIF